MVCNNCGKQIPNESIFCNYCGQKILPPTSVTPSSNKENVPIPSAIYEKETEPQKPIDNSCWNKFSCIIYLLGFICVIVTLYRFLPFGATPRTLLLLFLFGPVLAFCFIIIIERYWKAFTIFLLLFILFSQVSWHLYLNNKPNQWQKASPESAVHFRAKENIKLYSYNGSGMARKPSYHISLNGKTVWDEGIYKLPLDSDIVVTATLHEKEVTKKIKIKKSDLQKPYTCELKLVFDNGYDIITLKLEYLPPFFSTVFQL